MTHAERPKISIRFPEGIYRSVKIDMGLFEAYVPGKTDIEVNVPVKTTIYGTVEQNHCIDMSDTVAGDAVTIINEGALYPGNYSDVFLVNIGAETISNADFQKR